jgi:hypothetical protein
MTFKILKPYTELSAAGVVFEGFLRGIFSWTILEKSLDEVPSSDTTFRQAGSTTLTVKLRVSLNLNTTKSKRFWNNTITHNIQLRVLLRHTTSAVYQAFTNRKYVTMVEHRLVWIFLERIQKNRPLCITAICKLLEVCHSLVALNNWKAAMSAKHNTFCHHNSIAASTKRLNINRPDKQLAWRWCLN